MTNFKSDLNLIRKEWYNAFYSGNTEMGGHEKPWGNSYAAMNYLKHHLMN
ncbi:hypothetical protein ACSLOR_27225 [Klebsiella pneumoniae]